MKAVETIKKLGKVGEDKITGFSGVITSVAFDLYGCAQLWVTPKVNKDMILPEGKWFDEGRVKIGEVVITKDDVSVDDPGAENKSNPIH